VGKAIKEMRNKKATGDDDVPGDALKLLGEGGLKIMTELNITIYETGVSQGLDRSYNDCLKEKTTLQNTATITHSTSSHVQQR